MMSVPGFQKRGGGMMILSRFCYKPEDVDCRYCLHYRRRSCQVRTCPYIAERLKSGAIEYLDLILEYFGHIPHAGLHKRIQAVEHWSGPDQAVLHTVSVHLRSRFADRVWDDAPPGYLGEYLPLQGMDLRLEQLDELAENIRIMDQEDGALLKYLSVLEVEQPATLQEALRFSIELDDYERVPDDPEEYGKQVLERIGADEELISTLDGFTDFEAMGNFYMREDGVRRTEFGLLRKLSDPFPEVQDGLQMH